MNYGLFGSLLGVGKLIKDHSQDRLGCLPLVDNVNSLEAGREALVGLM